MKAAVNEQGQSMNGWGLTPADWMGSDPIIIYILCQVPTIILIEELV